MAGVDPLTIDWEKVQGLVTQARILKGQFPNEEFITDPNKREILEKIAVSIIDLIHQD